MTAAVILAGGLARRMGGGDKSRQLVGGRSVLVRTIECLGPQSGLMAINANGDPARFAEFGLPVLADSLPDHPGPLAGVLAGLDWAAGRGVAWLVSVPGDCPFLPDDLVRRLHTVREAEEATLACAASGGWNHPVIGLWPTRLRGELREALLAGQRKIDAYTARHRLAVANWATAPHDPFFNVNTPEDLVEANRSVSGFLEHHPTKRDHLSDKDARTQREAGAQADPLRSDWAPAMGRASQTPAKKGKRV